MAGRLRVYIEPDADDLVVSTRAASRSVGRLSGRESTGAAGTKSSGSMLRSGAAFSVGAVGSAAAVAGFFTLTQFQPAIDATDDLVNGTVNLKENFGLSTKDASAWSATIMTRGGNTNQLGQAFKALSKNVVAAREGTTTAIATFEKLGISEQEVETGSRDISALLGDVGDGLANLGAGSDKTAISGKLFGKGWASVQPVLRDGKAAMEETLDLADAYGVAFNPNSLKSTASAVSDLGGATTELKMSMLGMQVQLTTKLIPAISLVAKKIGDVIRGAIKGKGLVFEIVDVFKVVLFPVTQVVKFYVGLWIKVVPWIVRQLVAHAKRLAAVYVWIARVFDGPIRAVGEVVADVVRGFRERFGFVAGVFKGAVKALDKYLGPLAAKLEAIVRIATVTLGIADAGLPPPPEVEFPRAPAAKGYHSKKEPQRRQLGGPVRRMATGGSVTGDIVGLNPGLMGALRSMAGAGGAISVQSGLRTRSEQEALYAAYQAGTGNLAAVPGTSAHESGNAADITPGREHFGGMAGQFGLSFTVPSESWHIELTNPGAASAATVAKIGRIIIRGRGPLANIAQGSADMIRNAANRYIEKLQPAVATSGPVGGGVLSEAEFAAYARQAIQITGHHEFTIGGLLILARAESGLDPNAQNTWDSNAAAGDPSGGLMQVIGATFRAYHQPGTSMNLFDPVANIAASINYQVARYGGQITFSPYASGGPVDRSPPTDDSLDAIRFDHLEKELAEMIENRNALAVDDELSTALTGLALCR